MNTKVVIKNMISWLQKEVKKANAKGVVFGVSGGVDSAVVAAIAKKAFPKTHLGLWINIESSTTASRNALRLFEELNLTKKRINLSTIFPKLVGNILEEVDCKPDDLECFDKNNQGLEVPMKNTYLKNKNYKQVIGNFKARLRMATIYEFAQLHNYLVIGTSNKAEYTMGYFTKWGDIASDLHLLANLTKSEIYELAKELKINERILNTPPSADLYEGQTDEKEMGVTYKDIDAYISKKKVAPKVSKLIKDAEKNSQHKKNIQLNSFKK